MARPKYDGVVQAVHLKPDQEVDWVRTYLRRGPVWSDYIILSRQTLIEQLKAGKNFVVGERVRQMAGTFEVSQPVHVVEKNGKEFLAVGDGVSGRVASSQVDRDKMDGVPLI